MTSTTKQLFIWYCLCLYAFVGIPVWAAERTLTTAKEIRSLTAEEAGQKLPVQLQGTVVFIEGPNGAVVLQDDTAGTYFIGRNERTLSIGDAVMVRGMTSPGSYLPGIELIQYEKLGRRELPVAVPSAYQDIASGQYFFQRVAIEGIVQSVTATADESRSILSLAMGHDLLEIRICAPPEAGRQLVDSRVRIEGIASGGINQRRQLVQPILWVHNWDGLQVLEPAPPLSAVPLLLCSQLLAYEASGHRGRRVRVAGSVIAAFPDGEVFIRDDTTALRLQLQRSMTLSEGPEIEVIGFPKMDRFSASLVNAQVIQQKAGPKQAPIDSSFQDILRGKHDNDLVSVTGEVSGTFQTEDGTMLALHDGPRTIRARIPSLPQEPVPGTRIQVIGICLVESNTASGVTSSPRAVSLRSRYVTDVAILSAPSWWTAQRLTLVAGALLIAVALTSLWIILLRRQVHRQTQALRSQIEHEAALEERQRIAREFHDTLEQGLTGLALRLDTVRARSTDEKNGQLLQASRSLVTQIHAETRSLVSSLRQPYRDSMDLGTELRRIIEEQPIGCGQTVLDLQIEHALPFFPSHTVHHLKMVAREAVTNALKHAKPQHINLTLTLMGDHLHMVITDDGCGFDGAAKRDTRGTSFGCIGIEERCDKLGATAHWESTPGQGTRLVVVLPLGDHVAPSPQTPLS